MASIRARFLRQFVKYRIGKILRVDKPIDEQRKLINQLNILSVSSPFTSIKEVFVDQMRAEWVAHRKARTDHIVIYLHGGGYNVGSPMMCRLLAECLSGKSNALVVVPDYRIAPEHPFPAAVEDAVDLYCWLLDRGFHAKKIAFAGDSAGGGLAIATALGLRERDKPLPASIVAFSPWVDLRPESEEYRTQTDKEIVLNEAWIREAAKNYSAGKHADNPLCSPILADLSGLPPLLIQTSKHELLNSDAVRLAEAYKAAGNTVVLDEWDGLWHSWQLFVKFLPEAGKAIDHACGFINSQWRKVKNGDSMRHVVD